MEKNLFIAEKPSVAKEFAKALKLNTSNRDGYLESNEAIITWCVGHLVTMSYPEVYDIIYKRWSFQTIPFIPQEYKYEVIASVKKQYQTVSSLLNRQDVSTIYVCTDSGREGEYIYRLVEQMSGVSNKSRKRVWIDSQTEDEILRGIREAKNLEEYDHLSDAAFLRAKEDYLMGINFSRALTLKYGYTIKDLLKRDKAVVSVGRVMTCVLGMVVKREREIRAFDKTPFFRVMGNFSIQDKEFAGEWRAEEGSRYFESPLLYKENGFKEVNTAQKLIEYLSMPNVQEPKIINIERKRENKNPPLLYNLAELQNECSKLFKISPDETLKIVQELYEKKMVTYPRTDARVLSSAVAKEIHKNLNGLKGYSTIAEYADEILQEESYKKITKSRYVNDSQITDHYAIVPTGQGIQNFKSLSGISAGVYELITRRFLSIFYPAAVYMKTTLVAEVIDEDEKKEKFISNFKYLEKEGYLKVARHTFGRKSETKTANEDIGSKSGSVINEELRKESNDENEDNDENVDELQGTQESELRDILSKVTKGDSLQLVSYEIKEGETSPPKRYNSGNIILTMENAGQFIEDDELRAQIKGSGIGTSATRAEILKKLFNIDYLSLNKKTQIITPTLLGELIYDAVDNSIRPLLDPALTASWEKGLTLVADGNITADEYMVKLSDFITRRTENVKNLQNQSLLGQQYRTVQTFYQNKKGK